MATEGQQAALLCGICNETFISEKLGALHCGHMICTQCFDRLKDSPVRGKCPYCRRDLLPAEKPVPIFAELQVVSGSAVSSVIEQTRQRTEHLFDGLGQMLSLEQLRGLYRDTRVQRAEVRNAASGSQNGDLRTLAIALTEAVDVLEDQLLATLEKEKVASQDRDYKKKFEEQKKKHTRETQATKVQIEQLKAKIKDGEEDLKRATAKASKYKSKLDEVNTAQEEQAKRADAASSALDAAKNELAQIKIEHSRFQSQLADHKVKEKKQKEQIRALKEELKQLKEKETKAPPKEQTKDKQNIPIFEISDASSPARPLDVSLSSPLRPEGDRSVINLVSSSPVQSPIAAPKSRKRSREPDENHYKRAKTMNLLPPPKARAADSTRIQGEVLENVAFSANGGVIKRKAPATKKPKTQLVQPTGEISSSRPKPTQTKQLVLGDGGKLVGIAKKKIRAV